MAVDDPDRIVGIEGDLQIAANRLDRLHMARRDIAGRADQRERYLRTRISLSFDPARPVLPQALTMCSPVTPARAQAFRVSTTSLAWLARLS